MTREEKIELVALLEEKQRRAEAAKIDCTTLSRDEANTIYREVMQSKNTAAMRRLCLTDLFFLLVYGCGRKDVDRDWLYDRSREVRAAPDGYLDLWARDHYKSTIITFALTIQDILNVPESTIGIFSHTRPIAKSFLDQIKRELEGNEFLKDLFPDVLFQNPKSEAPKWSLDFGIVVKRRTNPKEATVEAWGLVDGQPTSKHFSHQIYDDVVTVASVSTPEQIKKTTQAWELSLNLGSGENTHRRYIGTRYHFNDTYREMMARGSVVPRIKPATHNGKAPPEGKPVFLSEELLAEKRRDQGPYTFGTQQLQNPVADKAMGFKEEWLTYYVSLGDTTRWNKYILVDPASSKKPSADYTVMEVIGLAPDQNYYLIDAFRDRLNLTERTNKLFELHQMHKPAGVAYEKYGMQADIEHIESEQERRNYRFQITEVGGTLSKEDRIRKLIPIYEQRRFYSPKRLMFVDHEGVTRDYVMMFNSEEYSAFPVSVHDDMLDCRARIVDAALNAKFPKAKPKRKMAPTTFASGTAWMG